MPGKRIIHVCILLSIIVVTGCEKYELCPPGLTWCWAECVDLNSDEDNCGSCGNECLPGGSCSDGVCEYEGCTTREDCAGPECLVCKDNECVPPPPVCYSDQDCCVGYNCNMGHCEAAGPGCSSDDDCIDPEKPRCVDGRCEPAPTCTVESCQTGEWCDVSVGECLPGCDEDSDCVPPEICILIAHQCAAVQPGQLGDPCTYDTVNAAAGDCDEGLVCLGKAADGSSGTCPNGHPWECEEIYESVDPDCVDGNCGYSFCSQECDAQWHCPSGFDPQDRNGTCYCIPYMIGQWPTGNPCPSGDVNDGYDYCPPGLRCLGRAADGNSGTCPGGDPAECTEYPASQNPDCVNGNCGYSFCAARCDAQGNCPTGHEPMDANGTCYCIPGAIGNSQLGDPCPYEDVNATAYYCAAGLECLGIPADGLAGTCPGGEPHECTNLINLWNIDCVNGNCGASFCSQECDHCDECPEGFDPQDVGSPARCMCVPGYIGEQPGGVCPFGPFNDEYDSCASGLTCLGNDNMGECPSGCVEDCSHIPCNYHPDCVDHVCGFSFCAFECDAEGNCMQEFEPVEVSGTCYCIPANPGDAQAGDPCPLNDFNSSSDQCDVFLTCLGNDNAGSCPAGNPMECTGIPAAYNPDCVNGICGYSFCSARCDDQNSCPQGFRAQDEDAICYCVPE